MTELDLPAIGIQINHQAPKLSPSLRSFNQSSLRTYHNGRRNQGAQFANTRQSGAGLLLLHAYVSLTTHLLASGLFPTGVISFREAIAWDGILGVVSTKPLGNCIAFGRFGEANFIANDAFPTDFWGPASNFGIPIAAVMDTQKDPNMYVTSQCHLLPVCIDAWPTALLGECFISI